MRKLTAIKDTLVITGVILFAVLTTFHMAEVNRKAWNSFNIYNQRGVK